MLRLIGRYVFREILTSAVLGTLLATIIIFLKAADRLFAVLVNSNNVAFLDIVKLFAWNIPPVLPQTIPFGVLVGILIGLGRLASDGEITAMRAAGVSSRRVIAPVLLFALIGTGIAGYASLRLTPQSIQESTILLNRIAETQLTADIEPRIFVENFPNKILYVGNVQPGPVARWTSVFIADVTPPSQRTSGMKDKADGPMVMVAREALAVSNYKRNRVELTMTDVSTHEMGKDGLANDDHAQRKTQGLDAAPPEQKALQANSMSTRQLMKYYGKDWIEVNVELHKRFAMPVACLVLAMVGIPLGIATRKGGKSAGYIIALFLGFFCYYLSLVSLISVARARTIPIPVAVWLPDAAFFLAGVIFLYRMESPGDRDLMSSIKGLFAPLGRLLDVAGRKVEERPGTAAWRLPLLPQLVDTYVLSNFVFYIVMVLASLVSMILVYNFFELMGDEIRNHIPLSKMFEYLFFLTPMEIYEQLPISILVGVLINLGVLCKNNEITAFKACGVSLYRLAAPILVGSTLFSGALFAFDYLYVPAANLRQDALRDLIKGKTSSRQRPDRKWMMGQGQPHLLLSLFRHHRPGDERRLRLRTGTEHLPPAARDHRGARHLEPIVENVGLRKWLELHVHGLQLHTVPLLPRRWAGQRAEHSRHHFLRAHRRAGVFSQGNAPVQADEFHGARYLHQRPVASRHSYYEPASAVLPQILDAAIRTDHGGAGSAVRIYGGESGRDDGGGCEPRHRAFLSRGEHPV